MAKVSFNNKSSLFFNDLKQAVDHYFSANQIRKTGNIKLYMKTIVLIPAAVLIYVSLLTVSFPVWVALLLCGFLGVIFASIGFNVMHDANHGSYSSKKWVNELFGYSINALGGNAFIWKFKHNIIHHTYTNVDGVDDDIARSPLLRQCSTQVWKPAHKFQHIYVVFLYAISSLAWVAYLDFDKYFKRKVNTTSMSKMDVKEHILFWVSKLLYAVFYVAVPIWFVGVGKWAIGYLTMELVLGFVLAIVFQLAHVVEETEFEYAGIEPVMIESEWAAHQVKTTSDFAPKNKLISWFAGGLNFQVEHHLFPRISHIHYPELSKIVEEKCKEHQLPYHSIPTMNEAIASHFRMLKQLGQSSVSSSGLVA
ncbi:MAG: acyl-CoA desaturase [Chitinophagaceae bacterium]|nr:acyl-CoA desaturase [Chitinophagaceae bacterium]